MSTASPASDTRKKQSKRDEVSPLARSLNHHTETVLADPPPKDRVGTVAKEGNSDSRELRRPVLLPVPADWADPRPLEQADRAEGNGRGIEAVSGFDCARKHERCRCQSTLRR